MERRSVRRRIRDAICAVLCQPTRPLSPPLEIPELPSAPDLRPSNEGPTLESAPPTVPDPAEGESSAQEAPKEPSGKDGSTETFESPEPLECAPLLPQGPTDTTSDSASTPSTPSYEAPAASATFSSPQTPQLCSPQTSDAPVHLSDTSTIDGEQAHAQPSPPPDEAHDHLVDNSQELSPNPPSVTSSIQALAVEPVPGVPSVEDLDPLSKMAEQGTSLDDGDSQGQQYLTSIVITLDVATSGAAQPLHLSALCPLGVEGSQEGKCIPLVQNSLQVWTLHGYIVLPLQACGIYCVVKDKEGHDIGFVYLKQEDVQIGGESAWRFVTHDSQLNLSMFWKIVHNAPQSPGDYLLQPRDTNTLMGVMLDNPQIDPAILNSVLDHLTYGQENSMIDTPQDYHSEGVKLALRFESTGHLDDINKSIVALQRAVKITAKGHTALPGMLNNLGNSFKSRFQRTGDMTDISEAITVQEKAVQLTPEGHADLPAMLSNLGNSFQCRFKHTSNMTDITEAVAVHQKAVQLAPEGHADMLAMLNNLGITLRSRFQRTGDMTDIARAITTQQKAVHLTPEDHADLPGMLNNLGTTFQSCFQYTGDMAHITQAITAQQKAVQLAPEDHADLPGWLSNLGNSFECRFQHTGDMSDTTRAITAHQKAVQLTPEGHADLPAMLSNLGNSFKSCFQCTGNMTYITEAITAQQKAVHLTPEGHAYLPVMLSNLANSFASRFWCTGNMTDIAEAITVQQKAVQLTPEDHAGLPSMLSNLGTTFRSRFHHTGDMTDITAAVTAQQKAIHLTPEGHADLPAMLNNLGTIFQSRFQHTGDITDIANTITIQQKAVHLTPEDHADLPGMLNNLGAAFQSRFQCTGNMIDIAEAITAYQKAVHLTPEGHADLARRLSNLGNSFECRFQRTGDMTDIDEAIAVHQKAVQLAPEGHTDLPAMLHNLGNSFGSRFEHNGNITDIAEAITVQQKAVQLTPEDHADLPGMLNNLSNTFQSRFEHNGNITDISEAITVQQKAVQLTPEGHADLPGMLNNLGNLFGSHFQCTGDMTDITKAITVQQKSVHLTPDGHAELPLMLHNLGNSFHHRFKHTKSIGEEDCLEDMHASVKCFRTAAEDSAGAPTLRLQCARSWAGLIKHHNPESHDVLLPFATAVRLLTLMAGLERTLQGRHNQLQAVSDIALEAAAVACRLEQPEKAVEWLEQGRCLIWHQLIGLRTPMDNLQQEDSQLAQRLTDVAKQLELAGSTRTTLNPAMDTSAKISLEEAARSHQQLAQEWDELLLAARRIPGFESFLLPSPCSTLLQCLPDSGPIIIINTHQDRCDALALLCGLEEPLHIPLPNFSLEKANQYRHALKNKLDHNRIRMRGEMGSSDKKIEGTQVRDMTQDWPDETAAPDTAVNEVLQSLWFEVAKPILDMLGYSRCDTSSNSVPPRIWWCPTGVTSFLPIHAAGIYGGHNSECLMDYVVSSYTPMITAITDRVKSSHLIDMAESGLFLTSQPKAPGAKEIPGTTKEVDEVYSKAKGNGVKALKCEGSDISVEDCRRYMGEFSSVHLACHASQNAAEPLQSRFLLHKGSLSLLSILQMDLKNADLAFLSACQTSTGEEKLSDEAVHLAAGMLAAGYRRVIATMWAIDDGHAPRVATDFYGYLWSHRDGETGDGCNSSLSAHALHHAVQQLRRRLGNSEKDLLTWVPYVHFGY